MASFLATIYILASATHVNIVTERCYSLMKVSALGRQGGWAGVILTANILYCRSCSISTGHEAIL